MMAVAVALLLLWIVFNGRFTWEIFWIGALVSAALYAGIRRITGLTFRAEMCLIKKIPDAIRYASLLIWEIIRANGQVLRLILSNKYEVEPVLVRFCVNLKSEGARVALANSITLTPGTITVTLEGNEYRVHCLDKSLAEGIECSEFVRLLKKLEA